MKNADKQLFTAVVSTWTPQRILDMELGWQDDYVRWIWI